MGNWFPDYSMLMVRSNFIQRNGMCYKIRNYIVEKILWDKVRKRKQGLEIIFEQKWQGSKWYCFGDYQFKYNFKLCRYLFRTLLFRFLSPPRTQLLNSRENYYNLVSLMNKLCYQSQLRYSSESFLCYCLFVRSLEKWI